MPYKKINIPDECMEFIDDCTETTGVPMQRFVVDAIKEKIMRMEAEVALRDNQILKD